jgi:hypothetical protein
MAAPVEQLLHRICRATEPPVAPQYTGITLISSMVSSNPFIDINSICEIVIKTVCTLMTVKSQVRVFILDREVKGSLYSFDSEVTRQFVLV